MTEPSGQTRQPYWYEVPYGPLTEEAHNNLVNSLSDIAMFEGQEVALRRYLGQANTTSVAIEPETQQNLGLVRSILKSKAGANIGGMAVGFVTNAMTAPNGPERWSYPSMTAALLANYLTRSAIEDNDYDLF